jgi:hypothetical protein
MISLPSFTSKRRRADRAARSLHAPIWMVCRAPYNIEDFRSVGDENEASSLIENLSIRGQ